MSTPDEFGNVGRVIGGKTLAQRRSRYDVVDEYPRERLLLNVERAKKKALKKEEKEERDREERNKRGRIDDFNAPLWKVWALLRPSWKTFFTTEGEAAGMMLICAVRLVEFRLQTSVVRLLEGTLNSRSLPDFKLGLFRMTAVSFGGALLSIIYNYLQSRLNHKWRVKLTDLLHDKYFKNMNYYYLGAGGGRGMDKMDDPDTRITSDLSQTVNGFTTTFSKAMYSGTAGVLYTVEIWRMFGFKFAIAPYIYLLAARALCQKIIPMRKIWRRRGRARGTSWGKYRFALQRQEYQGEAIGALRGSVREMEIVIDEFSCHIYDCHMHHRDFLIFHSVWNFFIQHGCREFVSILCIGRGIWFPKYENIDSIEKLADVRSDVGVQFMLFNNCMDACRTAINMVEDLQRLVGNVERVTELDELLDRVTESRIAAASESVVTDDCIAFEDVTIMTPKDVKLVDKLNFRLDPGGSLLIVGHNGAGKSSIFRCLGGLWTIPHGTIRKPRGSNEGASSKGASNDAMFYIPQKPYNVTGTLIDQMTYPDSTGGKDLTMERMTEILSEVDLEYLLERKGCLTEQVNWEDELSLSEKQRLAIARLIYNKPRYAILDECSSAITSHMEQRLYKICIENNITYITIAHRPALQAYHDHILAIGDGKCGFTLKKLDNEEIKKKVREMARKSILPTEIEASIRNHAKARSAPYQYMATMKEMPKRSTWSRWVRLWHICKPKWWLIKFILVLFFIAVQISVEDFTFGNTGRMYGALMNRDKGMMWRLIRNAMVSGALQGWMWEQMLFIERELGLDMSDKLERHLASRLAANNKAYTMTSVDGRIKDIDHRISMDAGILMRHNVGQILIGFIRPISKVLWFTYRIGGLLGWQWPAVMIGYYFVSMWMQKLCMPDFRLLWQTLSSLESKFHKAHSRVKICAESIAFFDGGAREKVIVEERFRAVSAHEWERLWIDFKFRCVQDIFQTRIPDVLQWTIRFMYGYLYAGSDENVLSDRGSRLNEGQAYIMAMIPQITGNLGAVLQLATFAAEMAGKIDRTGELQEILDELDDELLLHKEAEALKEAEAQQQPPPPQPQLASSPSKGKRQQKKRGTPSPLPGGEEEQVKIVMKEADIVTPRGECIAAKMSFAVTPGHGLMVTGRGGTGKTSFARVMSGLWTAEGGTLHRPKLSGVPPLESLKKVFVVPQKIHMALGTLQDQLTYPEYIPKEQRTPEMESKMQSLLDLVGIGYLVERWEGDADETNYEHHLGWDHEVRWEDVLSLGEQQRMGVARMFWHQPQIGILDECTSAVSVDVEESLYRHAYERGITLVTLSQHMTLPEFHPVEIVIGENNAAGWTTHKVDQSQKNLMMSGTSSGARADAVAQLE